MVDHCVFNREAAVCRHDALVIWRAVLTRVGNFTVFHGFFRFRQIPVFGTRAGKRDGASCIELQDRVHRRRGDEIDIFKRFLQNGDVFRKTVRHGTVFRHNEVAGILNGDEPCTAGALVHGELFRVFERIGAFDLKICLRFIGLRWA